MKKIGEKTNSEKDSQLKRSNKDRKTNREGQTVEKNQ